MVFRAAVTYCGGCNPIISRAGLIRSLARKTGLAIHPAGEAGPEVELLIAACGCARGCLRLTGGPSRYKELIVVAG